MRGRLGPQIIYLQYRVCVMLSASVWLMKRGNLSPAAALRNLRENHCGCGTSWGCRDSTLDITRDQPGFPTAGEDNAQVQFLSCGPMLVRVKAKSSETMRNQNKSSHHHLPCPRLAAARDMGPSLSTTDCTAHTLSCPQWHLPWPQQVLPGSNTRCASDTSSTRRGKE